MKLKNQARQDKHRKQPSNNKIAWFQDHLLKWYEHFGRKFPWRKKGASVYKKVISELLLQRTTASAVSAYVEGFLDRFPTWEAISKAKLRNLQKELRPLGLWRRRALSMKQLAMEMTQRKGRFPENKSELEILPGIGQYMANAILVLRHKKAEPFLDTNMSRVLERFFGPRKLADIRYDPYLQKLATRAVSSSKPAKVNFAILDFGALICTARNPRCAYCPLAEKCLYYKNIYSKT